MTFKQHVQEEAKKQKELRALGQPIPSEYKKYARLSGLFAWLISGVGSLVILGIGFSSGSYYVAFILLFAVLSVGGLIQLITGKHLLSRAR